MLLNMIPIMVHFCTLMLQIWSKWSSGKLQKRGRGIKITKVKGCRVLLQEPTRGEIKHIILPSSGKIGAKLIFYFPIYMCPANIKLMTSLHFIQLVMYYRTGNLYYPSLYLIEI